MAVIPEQIRHRSFQPTELNVQCHTNSHDLNVMLHQSHITETVTVTGLLDQSAVMVKTQMSSCVCVSAVTQWIINTSLPTHTLMEVPVSTHWPMFSTNKLF